MHLVTKHIKGIEYFYLVKKERRGKRVVTAKTTYIGNRQKLAELVELSALNAFPSEATVQEIGVSLALARIAADLGIEEIIEEVCPPSRVDATPIGRRVVLAAIHRAMAPRCSNSLLSLQRSYVGSSLAEILPTETTGLDNRRMCEALARIGAKQIERIESAVVRRVVEKENIALGALAFDCTNFDSYAGARTPSRLLRRGHNKSGKPLRTLGLGLLVTADDGMPLLTFAYPGNENDVTAFGRFLKALDRRCESLALPLEATVAADGGNISRQMLLKLEKKPRHYVLRLPGKHVDLPPAKSTDLPWLHGSLKGKVRARKLRCRVYGVERCVIDQYSVRMHQRQRPGLERDRKRARQDLERLQFLLERQRQGLRSAKPLTVRIVKQRVAQALSREHMGNLFQVQVEKGDRAPSLHFQESEAVWQHLHDCVLGRTLLVTDQKDWSVEEVIYSSRVQSRNENLFRDIKDPNGVSMLPLRHRSDAAIRAHSLVVVLGLMLAKVLQRRVRRSGAEAPTVASVLEELRGIRRISVRYGPEAPPALRALSEGRWIPSARSDRQLDLLRALGLHERPELGTTLASAFKRLSFGKAARRSRDPGNSR
jgi:transposase